jgi:hypothetical protein
VGKDSKILGPQETQLIRQCTAAALNVAASIEEGGNCGTGPTASITDTMAACCSGTSICTGDAVEGFSMESCLSKLDAFNNDITTIDSDLFKNPGRADPSLCQRSGNNGVVVSPAP